MTQKILTYPWDSAYPKSSLTQFFGASAGWPAKPTTAYVDYGRFDINEAGYNWRYSGATSNIPDGDLPDLYSRALQSGVAKQGYGFSHTQTNSNTVNIYRYINVGDESDKVDGQLVDINAKSSWLEEVTSCWFVLNSYGTSTRNDCNVQVLQVAIRYVHPVTNRIVMLTCPEVLTGLFYGEKLFHGGNPKICGYSLSNFDAAGIIADKLRFLGFRIQVLINRGTSTTFREDTLNLFINGLTPGFGTSNVDYDQDKKRVICRNSETVYDTLALESKYPVELG